LGGAPSAFIVETDAGEDYSVDAVDGRLELLRASDHRPLTGPLPDQSAESARQAIARLEHVARWARVAALENPSTRIKPTDVALEIYVGKNATPEQKPEIELSYRTGEDNKVIAPVFKVKLKNNSDRTL
jgi:hypothetical protein